MRQKIWIQIHDDQAHVENLKMELDSMGSKDSIEKCNFGSLSKIL